MIKVKKTTATTSETSSTLDLTEYLEDVPEDLKEDALQEIGEALIEITLDSVAQSKGPMGNKFKGLSKQYKAFKLDETGVGEPNLDLNGDMLSSLDYRIKNTNELVIGIFGEDAPKADGHNNFSGRSRFKKSAQRQFLPSEELEYTNGVAKKIDDVVRFFKADKVDETKIEDKLNTVETKADLYELLKEEIGDYSRAKLKQAALASNLKILLDEYDLTDLL